MNQLRRLLAVVLRGSDSGQSFVEYLTIVGACALVGIAGFTRYGQAVKSDSSANARHIEGEGLPNTEGILGSLGADYNEIPGWCVKPNYCFAAGTPVQTEHGDRAIERIVVGDRVWARDVGSGAIALRPVVNTYRTARVPVVDLELSTRFMASEHLSVTRSHLFWVEGPGWVRAEALGAQPLWSTEQSTQARLTTSLIESPEPTTVYNLEVSDFHSYFVGHSHVLVHNGNPNGDGCPTETTPTITTRPPRTWGPRLECGETGSYYDDLGGWDKDNSSMRMARPSNGLARDHIPSSRALQERATKLLDDLAARLSGMRCRELTAAEQKALTAAKELAAAQLDKEATYDGFAVAEPPPLHAAGRTYQNKNKSLYENDSRDLALAAQKDRKALEAAIAAGVPPIEPDCAAAILAALQTIGEKTQEDYDSELGALAQAQLENSGFNKIIRDTCEGHDLQTESQRQ